LVQLGDDVTKRLAIVKFEPGFEAKDFRLPREPVLRYPSADIVFDFSTGDQ
jgi:hypothetical protein